MSRRALIALIALVAVSTLALGVPAASGVQAQSGIELTAGSGRATLSLRGAALGSIERGRIQVTTFPGREAPEVLVQGADWQRTVGGRTTVYGGEGIRFRVFRGAWRLRIQGIGINASAVGHGIVGLRGRGRYSVAGAAYRPWPAEYETIRLGD